MKYRVLTKQEMEIFDEDFKYFLITNGVKNEEWLAMNQSDIEKATTLVELFSDTVLHKVYEKIEFIEFRSPDACMIFRCLPERMELISLNKKQGISDLSSPETIHEALSKSPEDLSIFKSEKTYSLSREEEMHELFEKGCFISSQEFWNALQVLVV
jgi:Family of unknown function (DUF6495)